MCVTRLAKMLKNILYLNCENILENRSPLQDPILETATAVILSTSPLSLLPLLGTNWREPISHHHHFDQDVQP